MEPAENSRWVLPLLLVILYQINNAQALVDDWIPEGVESICNTDDLNHSKLVECKLTQCDSEPAERTKLLASESRGKFLHMVSSRNGDRFSSHLLDSLDYVQTNYEKSMDINTTFYVDTTRRHHKIHGFGTTIDLTSISDHNGDAKIQEIIKQLFAVQKTDGIQLSLLRIPISRETLTEGRVMRALNAVDEALSKSLGDGVRLKLVLTFEYWPSTSIKDIEALESISLEGFKALECWAVAIPCLPSQGVVSEGLWDFIRDRCFGTKNMLVHVAINKAAQCVKQMRPGVNGLLIESDFESPYNSIDQVFKLRKDLGLISIGSPKTLIGDYGNWQTAQHHAVEIMNHLKHDSLGFIEARSIVDVFASEPAVQDGSIYKLGSGYETYFKGPLFYAMGHFSRHVVPGSIRLDAEISTQPNMFAADYMAFLTPKRDVVVVVLNDNEHDLPFRLAIDQRIRFHVMLQSKSFNTFVIKP